MKKRKNYFYLKLYELDFKRINEQNTIFNELKKKLSLLIQNINNNIEFNNNIKDKYLEDPINKDKYDTLIDSIETIESQYKDMVKEFTKIKESENLIKL